MPRMPVMPNRHFALRATVLEVRNILLSTINRDLSFGAARHIGSSIRRPPEPALRPALRRHCVDAASRRHHRRGRLHRAGRSTDRASASSTRSGVRSSGRGPTAETCPVSRSSYASWDVSRRTLICSCLLRECVLPPETEQGKFLAGPLRNPAADGSRVIAVCRPQSPFQRNLRSRAFFCNRNAYTGCRSPRLPDEREFFQLGDALRPMVTKGIIIDPYVSVGTRRCGKPGTDESIRSTAEHRSRCPKELDSALTRIVIHRPKSARRNG